MSKLHTIKELLMLADKKLKSGIEIPSFLLKADDSQMVYKITVKKVTTAKLV